MSVFIRPYASCGTVRMGIVLLVLLCLLAEGCGKARVGGSDGVTRPKNGSAVVATAKSQIGRPYKYGGTEPKTGFDCSGLILWTYKQHGVKVPRQAKEQAHHGKVIKKSQLQPGDIVVFRISGRSGYHTGLYSGKGKFVHSPSSGKKIREDNMNDAYWKRRYVSGRRVL